MEDIKKRTFELTTAFAMGSYCGKLIAIKSLSAIPELSDRSRTRIEERIASTSARKESAERVLKETYPEFWDELSGLESFKCKSAIIELLFKKGPERDERDEKDKEFEDLLKTDSFRCDTVSPSSEKEDQKMSKKAKAMPLHSMGQFYGNLFLIGELSRIEDLSPEVKEMLETIKQAAERHKELVVKTLMIFNPDLLSLIHEIEADQDLDLGKELAS